MAKNKSTSQVRQSRNSNRNQVGGKDRNPTPASAAPVFYPEALRDAIEEERSRLMDVEALLHCVILALDDDDRWNTHGPSYQSVVGIARDLVIKTIDQLDSVTLRPILAQAKHETDIDYAEIDAAIGRKLEVKERGAEYLH